MLSLLSITNKSPPKKTKNIREFIKATSAVKLHYPVKYRGVYLFHWLPASNLSNAFITCIVSGCARDVFFFVSMHLFCILHNCLRCVDANNRMQLRLELLPLTSPLSCLSHTLCVFEGHACETSVQWTRLKVQHFFLFSFLVPTFIVPRGWLTITLSRLTFNPVLSSRATFLFVADIRPARWTLAGREVASVLWHCRQPFLNT